MARGRSKSPAKKAAPKKAAKAPAPDMSLDNPMIQAGITVALLGGLTFRSQGGVAPGDFLAFLGDIESKNVDIGCCAFNFIMLGHQLNVLDSASGGGYWLNNFASAVFEAFSAPLVIAVFGGTSISDAVFGLPLCNFFVLWYLINQDFFGLWTTVKKFGGEAFSNVLGISTDLYTTNNIIAAAGSSDCLMRGIVTGTIAGTAHSFWPLSKGIKFSRSTDHDHAFTSSAFVAGNGFALFDTFVAKVISFVPVAGIAAPELGAMANGFLTTAGLSAAQFVLAVTIVNQLFGEFNPLGQFTGKLKAGFDCLGVYDKVTGLLRL